MSSRYDRQDEEKHNLVIWKDKSKFKEEKGENIKKYCEP